MTRNVVFLNIEKNSEFGKIVHSIVLDVLVGPREACNIVKMIIILLQCPDSTYQRCHIPFNQWLILLLSYNINIKVFNRLL